MTAKRDCMLAIRVTHEERELIRKRAQARDTSITDFVVGMTCDFTTNQLRQLWPAAKRGEARRRRPRNSA